MKLDSGLCYEVLKTDGSHVQFRFLGGPDEQGKTVVESPPGSGLTVDLSELLREGYQDYWPVPCPEDQTP